MTRAEDIEDAPAGLTPAAANAYVEARTQGLCHEGALEVAHGVERAVATGALRLETVEFKIAHLERALQELSDVLYRQQQQLDAAVAMNQRLREQLEEVDGRAGDSTPVEIPPHY
jgi:SlyX protein